MAKKKLTRQQRLQQLEQRRDELQRLYQQLSVQNSELSSTALIMDSMCDSLSALLQRQSGGSAAVADEDAVELLDLLEEEGGLLQQLAGLPAPLQHAALPSEGDNEQQQQQPMPISPPNDPMALFKHLLSQPRVELSQMTLEDVRASYTELVHGVSIQLNLHSAGLLSEACVVSRIQPGIVKFLSMSNQLTRGGRRDLINGLVRLRLDVPACQPATDAAAPACPEGPAAADLAATVVAKLGLSPQQEETINTGLVFFRRLLQLVDTQLAALQQDVPAAASAGTPTPQVPQRNNSSGRCSSSCTNGPSKGASEYEAAASRDGASASAPLDDQGELLAARQVELEAQQQRAMRLQVVCRKHALVTSAAVAWLAGQFTWLQLGKLFVLFWPYVPVWQHVWAAISRQRQERQGLQHNAAVATKAAVASTAAAAAAAAETAAAAAAPPAWERLHTLQQGCAANGSSVHAATSSISQPVQQ